MKLVRFRKTHEKIAMGFLSYIPGEKMVSKLQETIQQYENDENWKLFLYKEDEDYLGLIGIEVDEEQNKYTIQHISVNPSFRSEGIGQEMVQEIKEKFPNYQCHGTEFTIPFLERCQLKEEGADQ